MRREKVTPGERERMMFLYTEYEFTMREIARLLGLRSEVSVKYHLLKAGVELRPRGRKPGTVIVPNRSIQRCAFLYVRMRLSINQICEIEGLRYTSVRNRLLHAGVKLRDRSEAQEIRNHYRPEDHPRRPDGPWRKREERAA